MTTETSAPPQKLFTFASGGWVILLALLMTVGAALLVLYPVLTNGLHPPVGDGKHVDSYGFDLSKLAIPKEDLVASGNPKDQIDSLPAHLIETASPAEIALIRKNEHINFLTASDKVIGVSLNGETRAYPTRVLALHELANDTLGGVPLAVSYSPLCDSAVVFDRRIDGTKAPPAEFGVSGLLVDSNPVFFDRRKEPKQESLWPQLALRAVSGPKANQPMTLIPYTLTTWEQWTKEHPDTRAVLGRRTLKKEYGREPYMRYLQDDTLRFPVFPVYQGPLPKKTPILALSEDQGKSWRAIPATEGPSLKSQDFVIHAFIFAWYAQHPETDLSALK